MSNADSTWWVYLLACQDGRTYAGVTLNVEQRFKSHREGKGAKFTRANPPLAILGTQPFASKAAAHKAEYALKQLSRDERLKWAMLNPNHEPSRSPNPKHS